jgi:hypothetical protein
VQCEACVLILCGATAYTARSTVLCVQDFNRVSGIARDLEAEAIRRMDDLDRRQNETAAAEVTAVA